jgi:HEAT repeat protein
LAVDDILQKLTGSDRRSIGRVGEVVATVLENPQLFDSLFAGLFSADPLIRMRAGDAVEKITAEQPEYLQPYKTILIERVAKIDQPEVRWHVAQMFPRLAANQSEQAAMIDILREYLADNSKIVKTCAMQALADFAERDPSLRPDIIPLLEELTATGSPAMQSRGQKLLARLKQQSGLS